MITSESNLNIRLDKIDENVNINYKVISDLAKVVDETNKDIRGIKEDISEIKADIRQI